MGSTGKALHTTYLSYCQVSSFLMRTSSMEIGRGQSRRGEMRQATISLQIQGIMPLILLLLHQKRNKHHWQWWCLPEDEGGLKVLEMPLKYRLEMLCDWRGAGRAQGTPDVLRWYEKNRNRMILGMATQIWIEQQLYTVEELKAKVGE